MTKNIKSGSEKDPGGQAQEQNTSNEPKGRVIPAGTEQETGLTRGQTELPEDVKEKQEEDDSE